MIDGIVSGRLLLTPKIRHTARGSPYLIAKMQVYGYQSGNMHAPPVYGDVITFRDDVRLCMEALTPGAWVTVCGVIVPVVEAVNGVNETVFKITAHALLRNYRSGQTQGKGGVFELVRRAGWCETV